MRKLAIVGIFAAGLLGGWALQPRAVQAVEVQAQDKLVRAVERIAMAIERQDRGRAQEVVCKCGK